MKNHQIKGLESVSPVISGHRSIPEATKPQRAFPVSGLDKVQVTYITYIRTW